MREDESLGVIKRLESRQSNLFYFIFIFISLCGWGKRKIEVFHPIFLLFSLLFAVEYYVDSGQSG